MASGLVALLDDVAAIAKLAAASLDDAAGAAGKAGSKAVGVVIDDAAVTPRYVAGLAPQRELPIIAKITVGSLRNKLLILLPVALLLSAFAPWGLTPLLMLGGAYLCFEGAEKVLEAVSGQDVVEDADAALPPAELEKQKVAGAVRTDFILSAEIMAISLAQVSGGSILSQAIALAAVAVAITVGVYGVVALIVKMDDIGLHLAKRSGAATQAVGRGLVKGMPKVMEVLTIVGTAAMLWVGGGILLHGVEHYGLDAPAHLLHGWGEAAGGGILGWAVGALGAGVIGVVAGGIIALALHFLPLPGKKPH